MSNFDITLLVAPLSTKLDKPTTLVWKLPSGMVRTHNYICCILESSQWSHTEGAWTAQITMPGQLWDPGYPTELDLNFIFSMKNSAPSSPQPMDSFYYSSHFTPHSLIFLHTHLPLPHCTHHLSAIYTYPFHNYTHLRLSPIHLQAIRQWQLVLLVLVLVAMSTLILICMEAADMYVTHPIADQESPTTRNVCHE